MSPLAIRGAKICESYVKPGADLATAFTPVYRSCGCKGNIYACTATCRDFNLALVPNPISWTCQPTCKQTVAASCKAAVDEFAKLWIKVPKDEDEYCADLYKGSQIMANSCN